MADLNFRKKKDLYVKERVLLALLVASGCAYLLLTKIDTAILLTTFVKSLFISCPALALVGLSLITKKRKVTVALIIGLILVGIIGARVAIATKNYDLQGMMMAAIAELSIAYLAYLLVKGQLEKRAMEGVANTRSDHDRA